jgi:SsrA-binding protein
MTKPDNFKLVAENRYAYHQYHILERFEAGIALMGTEVKSIREGRVNLRDSFVRIVRGEAIAFNLHITPYSKTSQRDLNAARDRKLLLTRHEIEKLNGSLSQKGLTCVPLKMYFKRGFAKLEIAVAKGKQLYDKREALKERVHRREMDRALKSGIKSKRVK